MGDLACKELKSVGWFKYPGFCVVKTRIKAPRKAFKRVVFGKDIVFAAKEVCVVVKAFPVKAFRRIMEGAHLAT